MPLGFLGGLFGQQRVPRFQAPDISQVLAQTYAQIPGLAEATGRFNILLAPQLREAERIYRPGLFALEEETTQRILENLRLGAQIPEDVRQQVIQSALEGTAASGFGVTPGGRALVARDLGLTSLDILNQRIAQAAGRAPARQFQPQGIGITPGDIASQIIASQNVQNAYNTFASQIRSQNLQQLFATPLRLAGQAFGIYTGLGGLQEQRRLGAGILAALRGAGGAGGGGGFFAQQPIYAPTLVPPAPLTLGG